MKDLTTEERKNQMDAMRNELIEWAKSQGVDSSYIMGEFGMGGHPGMGMGEKGMGKFGNWKEK
jgi:hypothetical protein